MLTANNSRMADVQSMHMYDTVHTLYRLQTQPIIISDYFLAPIILISHFYSPSSIISHLTVSLGGDMMISMVSRLAALDAASIQSNPCRSIGGLLSPVIRSIGFNNRVGNRSCIHASMQPPPTPFRFSVPGGEERRRTKRQ